ncbi:YchJ family protein [Legionella sp. 16cNR16C]|uniref:YchJ family protein n=1 Tax=Legionella sp. 16cNR16C TaxID=2905656 RepID=UPI001E58D53B|nr:YchJ family metal-binding protein [Legionella sp. 16cNR16C]MCE3044292.1 SEC-C domain-containing protein [Legionella sp. 16cNR16C]
MNFCPCGSQLDYTVCCGILIDQGGKPATPEALMRSRYTAYTKANIPYIVKTMKGKPLAHFNESDAKEWAEQADWLGLEVLEALFPCEKANQGFVEFVARYHQSGLIKSIHERSEFLLDEGQWYYIDGHPPHHTRPTKTQRMSQNTACFCGSLKKYKNCHGRKLVGK